MIILSKLADYGVIVATHLAAFPDHQITAGAVAAATRLPQATVAKLLKSLAHAGLVVATRGASGGYRLARERRRISLGDIVRTVRGLETTEDPIGDPAGSALGHLIVRPVWLDLQEEMMGRLDSLTLDDLCARAHRAGISGRTTECTDFEI